MKVLPALFFPLVLAASSRQDTPGPRLASSTTPRGAAFVESFRDPGRYVLRDGRANAFVDATGVTLALRGEASGWALRWTVKGAQGRSISPRDEKPARVNYYLGNDPGRWKTGLPTYGTLVSSS